MHGTRSIWNAERDMQLAILWAAQYSCSQIAHRFPLLWSHRDQGRSMIAKRVAQLRQSALSETERLFWSRTLDGWNDDRDLELIHLWHHGVPTLKIAASLPFLNAYADPHAEVRKRVATHRREALSEAERSFWCRKTIVRTSVVQAEAPPTVQPPAHEIPHPVMIPLVKPTLPAWYADHAPRCGSVVPAKRSCGWTIERELDLLHYWSLGYSIAIIAERMSWLSEYPDHGRSAVSGYVKRLRDSASSDAERNFWSREERRNSAVHKRPKRPARVRSERKHIARKTLNRSELIASIVVPPVVTTDAEVQRDLEQRIMTDTPPASYIPWQVTRYAEPKPEPRSVAICTFQIGDGPCRKPAVARTARCIAHDGERIACIEYVDEQIKKPWLLAAAE